jgi:hypothetical protein
LDIKIDELILEATKCKKGFSCLSGKTECMCEVESSSGINVTIKAESAHSCHYLFQTSTSSYCLCPTRSVNYVGLLTADHIYPHIF